MSYEDDILIDETALDVEWLNQPRRMEDYCKLAAEARRSLDLAAEELEFVRATLERAVRLNPSDYGVTPGVRGITEDGIKAAIQVHPEYKSASKRHIDAKYESEVAIGAVRAFDQRKVALENLVRLHGQSYFAGPAVPRDLPAERAKLDRTAQRRVRISTPVHVGVAADTAITGGGGTSWTAARTTASDPPKKSLMRRGS